MIINTAHNNYINSPVRSIAAKVELYSGSTLTATYSNNDALISFTIERVGEDAKFFGFGVCQKINIKLLDKERAIHITTANSFNIVLGSGEDLLNKLFPRFYVSEVHRDENTNALSITAYDALYKAAAHTTSEIQLTSYTIGEYAEAAAALIGVNGVLYEGIGAEETCFSTVYENGANFDGTETIRAALTAISEATQTIYFLNYNNQLVFKRLALNTDSVITINKDKYFTLDSSTNRRLAQIVSATELGDNISASLEQSGTTQYVRNNPFWELREDIAALINSALSAIGGLTINQFNCAWRGNYLLEIGDKIDLTTKDNDIVSSYILNDTLEYNGVLSEKTEWKYTDNETDTAANPSNIGEAILNTYARVDKVNKDIQLVASEASTNKSNISSLLLNTDSIAATVTKIEEGTASSLNTLNDDLANLTQKVNATITAEDVNIQIQTAMSNGVDSVVTETGYTFNNDGLTVAKSDSEMKTAISDDGMTVYKNDEAVLVANNVGVDAVNLSATTYLIIGTNSRFENYGSDRTGCFYIGE